MGNVGARIWKRRIYDLKQLISVSIRCSTLLKEGNATRMDCFGLLFKTWCLHYAQWNTIAGGSLSGYMQPHLELQKTSYYFCHICSSTPPKTCKHTLMCKIGPSKQRFGELISCYNTLVTEKRKSDLTMTKKLLPYRGQSGKYNNYLCSLRVRCCCIFQQTSKVLKNCTKKTKGLGKLL